MNPVPRPLVHFHRLEDFARELPAGHTVRVVVLPQPPTTDLLDYALVGAHVRALDEDGTLLSCFVPATSAAHGGSVQVESARALTHRAESLGERVRQWLAGECGFHVRDGLLDLEGRQPVMGRWEGDPGPSPE